MCVIYEHILYITFLNETELNFGMKIISLKYLERIILFNINHCSYTYSYFMQIILFKSIH